MHACKNIMYFMSLDRFQIGEGLLVECAPSLLR